MTGTDVRDAEARGLAKFGARGTGSSKTGFGV